MSDNRKIGYTYHPAIFDANGIHEAKDVILTDEGPGKETAIRWSKETPYLGELIGQELGITADKLILDYGCGIGRLAKELISVYGCHVIGVDISSNMRRLAFDYVNDDRFVAVSPAQLTRLSDKGLKADTAISVWVLQHCLNPAEDIARLHGAIQPNGRLFVANMSKRAVPARRNDSAEFTWVSDGLDVWALLQATFAPLSDGILDPERCPGPTHAVDTSWRTMIRQ